MLRPTMRPVRSRRAPASPPALLTQVSLAAVCLHRPDQNRTRCSELGLSVAHLNVNDALELGRSRLNPLLLIEGQIDRRLLDPANERIPSQHALILCKTLPYPGAHNLVSQGWFAVLLPDFRNEMNVQEVFHTRE
jgi:hypothetical protein